MSAGTLGCNQARPEQILAHLWRCDAGFTPPLSARLDITAYANKITTHAQRLEYWDDNELVGLIAVYLDPPKHSAFITNVSVLPDHQGRGITSRLLEFCLQQARQQGCRCIALEVATANHAAIHLYHKHGFIRVEPCPSPSTTRMTMNLAPEPMMPRDFNQETSDTADHRYAYSFDFDVMHPFMMRTFQPFFRPGSLLELGSYQSDFTRRFLQHFTDITCVEASADALQKARQRLGTQAQFIHATFEQASLPRRYDNIVLTHVLEHLDDPVHVLKRINDEWLADDGRFFLVCPNANAPSRQIAVKMGLISHNAAVTPAESAHGHRITYTLDTLERDAVAAGLRVVHRSGIFFKALANFQWDRLLQTDIISPEYLEGCYQLGQVYPDLCASIFLLCERGSSTA